ncbi:response regulator transcription factor [Yoonia sp.]|uniref:helix-turn-helix transcriptional regulator n=1 Tax=Yoonia sp. TaxID=2212373 RepID=UPI003974CCE8
MQKRKSDSFDTAAVNFGQNRFKNIFAFLGSGLVFPNCILRVAEQEAGGVHAVRLDGPNDLYGLARDEQVVVRKVFFDDRFAPEVFRDLAGYKLVLPHADWILAYHDQTVAGQLLAERVDKPVLAGILLLQMNLPIGPWSSMLRLALSGQLVAATDLIAPQSTAAKIRPDAQNGYKKMAVVPPASGNHGLTRREKEVLALVSQGGSNKMIAHKMSLSEHTVKLHLHNATNKIGARNRTEAATWYLSRQLGIGP